MSVSRTDAQLIGDHLDGDEDSFRLLVERHIRPVFSFICRLMGDRDEAEDVTQEVFVRVWMNLAKYRAGESFRAWLYTIARNASYDWLRRRRPAAFSEYDGDDGSNVLSETLADAGPLPDELAADAETGRMLADLIGRLPPHFRAVLALRRDGDLTFEEIAAVMEKPVDTVKSHYRRGLARLRRMLSDGFRP